MFFTIKFYEIEIFFLIVYQQRSDRKGRQFYQKQKPLIRATEQKVDREFLIVILKQQNNGLCLGTDMELKTLASGQNI
jgi:hypothetical protein